MVFKEHDLDVLELGWIRALLEDLLDLRVLGNILERLDIFKFYLIGALFSFLPLFDWWNGSADRSGRLLLTELLLQGKWVLGGPASLLWKHRSKRGLLSQFLFIFSNLRRFQNYIKPWASLGFKRIRILVTLKSGLSYILILLPEAVIFGRFIYREDCFGTLLHALKS